MIFKARRLFRVFDLLWAMPALWVLAGLVLFAPGASGGETLRVGTWKTAQTIQPFFYQRFAPQGLRIFVRPFTNPADQKIALLAGSLDLCGTTIVHAVRSASLGEPVVVVASLCNKCSALVVRSDLPIRSCRDLKNKRIAYVPGTMHEILLREALARAGLNPNRDVRLVRVDFFDMAHALATRSVDAFLSGEPFPTIAVAQGYGRILSYPYFGESIGTINAGMLVRRDVLEKDPCRIERAVRLHALATRYLRTHREAWLRAASRFGVPLAILRKAAPNMEICWDMNEEYVRKCRALGKRMQDLGMIRKQPDYDRLFDLSLVRRVREELGGGC